MDADGELFDNLFSALRQSLINGSRQQALCWSSSVDRFGRSKGSLGRKDAVGTAVPPPTAAAASAVQHASASTSLCVGRDGPPWNLMGDFGVEHDTSTEASVVGTIRPPGCDPSQDQAAMGAALATPLAGRGTELQDSHKVMIHETIEENAVESLRRIRERRHRAESARRTRLTHITSRRDAFGHLTECRLAQAREERLVKTRRLLLQGAGSTRRLQELLHECVGEYEKARMKGARRRRLSAEACDAVLARKVLDLRWSRFCLRLEEDALGLATAHDMGDPNAGVAKDGHSHPAAVTGQGLIEAGFSSFSPPSSSSPSFATPAAGTASLVAPLLARSGFGGHRILRVVAVCPCVSGAGGGGDGGGGSNSGSRNPNTEGYGNAASNRRWGVSKSGGGGSGTTPTTTLRRRGDGIVGALREALRENERGGVGAPSSPAAAAAAAAVVLAVAEENSPLGVADVFRRALLCGNPGLVEALSPSDGGDDDGAAAVASAGGAAASDRRRRSSVNISAVQAGLIEPRRSSFALKSAVGQQQHLTAGNRSATTCATATNRGIRDGGGGGDGGSHDRCTVVEADPGLLLSSSHLLWTLHPPFGGPVGAPDSRDWNLFRRGSHSNSDADARDGASVTGGRAGAGRPGGEPTEWAAGSRASPAQGPGDTEEEAGDHIDDGDYAARTRNRNESSNGNGSRNNQRQEELDRDAAWIGAAPVGSRVYYCLEEAELEASRRREGRGSASCPLPPSSDFRSRSSGSGSGVSPRRGTQRSRRRPRPATGDAEPVEAGRDAGLGGQERKSCQEEEDEEDAGRDGTAGGGKEGSASAVLARSVSSMLADIYVSGHERRLFQDRKGGSEVEREGLETSRARASSVAEGVDAAAEAAAAAAAVAVETDVGSQRVNPQGNAWASLVEGGTTASVFAAADGTTSYVVGGVTDAHRRGALSKATNDEGERLEALEVVPDVLIAVSMAAFQGDRLGDKARSNLPRESRPPDENVVGGGGGSGPDDATTPKPASTAATGSSPPLLHFAPAGVLQLLGTPHCREFVAALPPAARARVLASHEGLPAAVPPVGRLYVALAPSRRRRPTPSSPLPSPLLGALVHPLPARAVRELLQIYVATTRAAGVLHAGGGAGGGGRRGVRGGTPGGARRRRTSGLFVLPPATPPSLTTTREGSTGDADSGTVESDHGGVKKKNKRRNECKHQRAAGRGSEGSGTSGTGGESAAVVGGRPQPRRLSRSSSADDDDEEESGGGDGIHDGTGGSLGTESNVGVVSAAAIPPSVVDVLPDGPISMAGRCGGDDNNALVAGTKTGRRTHQTPKQQQQQQECRGGRSAVEGCEAAAAAAAAAIPTRTAGGAADAPISVSLRVPFRHLYVAVLAPPTVSSGVSDSRDFNGQGAASSGRAGLGGAKRAKKLSGASALILQLEPPASPPKESPGSGGAANGEAFAGSGGPTAGAAVGATAAAGGRRKAGEVLVESRGGPGKGARRGAVPLPRVCEWRACLADAFPGPLCEAHVQLRDFLDEKAAKVGGVSEAVRFLPPASGPRRRSSLRKRRAAAAAAAEAQEDSNANNNNNNAHSRQSIIAAGAGSGGEMERSAVRSMSPLLSELLNGKLGTTIAMFCRRAAAEAKGSRRRGPQRQPAPEWAKWANREEVSCVDGKLEADTRWAEKVLRAEKEVTLELRRLSNLDVYPVAELARIRREHAVLATEWRQAGGDAAVARCGLRCGRGEDDSDGNNTGTSINIGRSNSGGKGNQNTTGGVFPVGTPFPDARSAPGDVGTKAAVAVAAAAASPALMPTMLPPSGTKRGRRKETSVPFPTLADATGTAAVAAAAAPDDGEAAAQGPAATATTNAAADETVASGRVTLSGPGTTAPLSSAGGVYGNRPDHAAADSAGGNRQGRAEGSVSGDDSGRGNGGDLARGRASTGVRKDAREVPCGGGGGGGTGERGGSLGSQARSEEEVELEFSRLKWALFRRRRQEAEVTRMVARGQAPPRGQASVQPLAAQPPLLTVASPAAAAGDGGGGSGGGGGRYLKGRDVGGSGTAVLRDSESSRSFAAPSAEHHLLPISTLLPPATGSSADNGVSGAGSSRPQQHQQQQYLVGMDKKLPASQQTLREDRLEPRLRHKQQLKVASSAGAGSGGDKQRSSSPQGGPRAVTTDAPRSMPMPKAAAAATALLTRRHSSPPPHEALNPDSKDAVTATAAAAAAAAEGERALSAVLVPPRAAARRVAVAAAHGPERDRDRGRRDRGKGIGGGLGGPARVVLRRRVSMGGSGSGGTATAAVAAAGVDRGARGFDATPYRTTVHFRDR